MPPAADPGRQCITDRRKSLVPARLAGRNPAEAWWTDYWLPDALGPSGYLPARIVMCRLADRTDRITRLFGQRLRSSRRTDSPIGSVTRAGLHPIVRGTGDWPPSAASLQCGLNSGRPHRGRACFHPRLHPGEPSGHQLEQPNTSPIPKAIPNTVHSKTHFSWPGYR